MHSNNLFDLINNLDPAARVPALRAIVHSMMAKTIGAIRQHLRDEERSVRDEDRVDSLDQRNGDDEDTRSVAELANAMGFGVQMPPLQQASILHSVYDWANVELHTAVQSRWDTPMSLDGMLEFMSKKAQPLDEHLLKALADAVKTTPDVIAKMHEMQDRAERERFIEMIPTIKLTFEGFGENGSETALDQLPVIAQHQLGVKVVEGLVKAQNNVLGRVMRTRRLTDLASIPLLEEGVKVVSEWVDAFEEQHRIEIGEALDAGRNIRTLDDVTAR